MALEPNQCSTSYETQDPVPLDYLHDENYRSSAYDVKLSVAIQGQNMNIPGIVTNSNLRNLYWNAKQQLVHHSVTGCIMNPGDLLGSGTISGSSTQSLGSLLELSWKGTRSVKLGGDGNTEEEEIRKFLKDGDTVIMTGYAQAPGKGRVGFGSCTGTIRPACTDTDASVCESKDDVLLKQQRFTDFKLFGFWRSSCTWRVRVALCAKAIPFETERVDILHEQAQKKEKYSTGVNAMSQVPVLECTDTSTGERLRITQSLAIIEFLEEAFPNVASSLLPNDPLEKAMVREISEIINSGIQPLQNVSLVAMVAEVVGKDKDTNSGRMIAKRYIEKGLEAIEKIVQERKEQKGEACGPFAIGGFCPTMADACLIPQLYNARRFGVDDTELGILCPTLLQVEAACSEHQWFRFSHPDSAK